MTTGWVWDERYMWHDTGTGAGPLRVSGWLEPMEHINSPTAKRRFANLVAASGLISTLTPVQARRATTTDIERVHTAEYRARIEQEAAFGGGDAGDGQSPFGSESYDIALLAAGGVLTALDAVANGTVTNAFALVRPPGHHASSETGWGFCIFNNVAIAARYAQQVLGFQRVAIIDWDVHHGNGTQDIFWRDGTVLTISLHQDGAYPAKSGPVEEVGEADGYGTNLNIPMPPGSGTGAYEYAFTQVVEVAIRDFTPDLILVASGLDANGADPLARQMLHSDGFRMLAERTLNLARELCEDRVVFVQEGGYSAHVVPFCGLAIVEAMSGTRTAVEDPFLDAIEGYGQGLLPHQQAAIDRAASNTRLGERR